MCQNIKQIICIIESIYDISVLSWHNKPKNSQPSPVWWEENERNKEKCWWKLQNCLYFTFKYWKKLYVLHWNHQALVASTFVYCVATQLDLFIEFKSTIKSLREINGRKIYCGNLRNHKVHEIWSLVWCVAFGFLICSCVK